MKKICDVVYVENQKLLTLLIQEILQNAVEEINKKFVAFRQTLYFAGPGTQATWLGIPVLWSQISAAKNNSRVWFK
jgi:hypothetical protein